MSRASGGAALGVGLVVCALAHAQELLPAEVRELQRLSQRDPATALGGLERLLDAKPTGRVRTALERARADALRALGRTHEAEDGWRALLARGVDTSPELFALGGAQLTVKLSAPEAPGVPQRLRLAGARTGPIELRVYRVDPARLRADPRRSRSLFERLRAPQPGGLSKLSTWSDPGFDAPGEREIQTPAALAPGIYLLGVTARDVTIPLPLVVGTAAAVARPNGRSFLVYLADRETGAPLTDLELTGYAADGYESRALGTTDVSGALRVSGEARWISAWRGEELLLFELPPPRGPRSPRAAVRLRADAPRLRPGDRVGVRVVGPKSEARTLLLVDPRGVVHERVALAPDRSGTSVTQLSLPPTASPGTWVARAGEAELKLPLLAESPQIELTIRSPETWSGPGPLRLELQASLATSGLPLGGRRVRWTLRGHPAAPPWPRASATPADPRPRPLAPYALRASGPSTQIAQGSIQLDARGVGRTEISWPTTPGVQLLVCDAELDAGPLKARATQTVQAAPSGLLVAVRAARAVTAPRELIPLVLCAAHLDGRPAERRDLTLRISRERHDGSLEQLELRRARTDARGLATSTLSLGVSGRIELELSAKDDDGRVSRSRTSVWLADEKARSAPGPLRVVVDPHSGQALARFPFETGFALATREAEGILSTRALTVRHATARWQPEAPLPPGCRVVVSAVGAGGIHTAEAVWPRPAQRLRVSGEGTEGEPGEALELALRTTNEDGKPQAARVDVTLYPETSARRFDRRADSLTLQRASGQPLPPRAVGAARLVVSARPEGTWSNGMGIASVRLSAPQTPGTYWARLETIDAKGRQGSGWSRVTVRAPVALELNAPETLVEGDSSQLAIRVRCDEAATLAPESVVRVSWRAKGLKLGTPRVVGSEVVLEGDPGGASLRLRASSDLRVLLPISCPGSSSIALEVAAQIEGNPAKPARATRTLDVLPRGLYEERLWTGTVNNREAEWVRLELPKAAVTETSRLAVALDPEPATAALAGCQTLGGPGLREPLQALLTRPALEAMLTARKLSPPALPPPPDFRALVFRLSAARTAKGDWGPATSSIALALVRLRALGQQVPEGLLGPALEALKDSPDPRAWAALSLAGRRPAGPPPTRPEGRVYVALVQGGAPEALAAAGASADALVSVEAKAELLALLVAHEGDAALRGALSRALLAARCGPGWADPDDAGAAVRALAAVAAGGKERKGARVEAVLEGETIVKGFSGGGLAEWVGVGRRAGVRPRSRLRLRAKEGGDLFYAVSLKARVRRALPPAEAHGLRLTRRLLTPDGGDLGTLAPGARFGLRFEVETFQAPPAEGPWEGLWVELPLPAGCALLHAPAALTLVDGALVGPLLEAPLHVELQALTPGEVRLLPARVRSLRDPSRWSTTPEATLRVRVPE